MAGRLYVVGTPLGNLGDLSPRAVRVLGEVALVAAEDTRAALRLLAHAGVHAKVVSCFTGNEAARAAELGERLRAGETIAYVSEAGMPGISDPGERLVRAAIEAGAAVEVVPGPSAALVALVGSGLPAERFTFLGFPPRDDGPRRELFGALRRREETLLFYESPNRAAATLADLCAAYGPQRRACLARELTKVHEEYVRGTLGELSARFSEEPPRGEVTLVVAGATPDEAAVEIDLEAAIDERLRAGESPKEIAAALALQTGKPRRQIYQLALARGGRR